jgi:hypothetical protein
MRTSDPPTRRNLTLKPSSTSSQPVALPLHERCLDRFTAYAADREYSISGQAVLNTKVADTLEMVHEP